MTATLPKPQSLAATARALRLAAVLGLYGGSLARRAQEAAERLTSAAERAEAPDADPLAGERLEEAALTAEATAHEALRTLRARQSLPDLQVELEALLRLARLARVLRLAQQDEAEAAPAAPVLPLAPSSATEVA